MLRRAALAGRGTSITFPSEDCSQRDSMKATRSSCTAASQARHRYQAGKDGYRAFGESGDECRMEVGNWNWTVGTRYPARLGAMGANNRIQYTYLVEGIINAAKDINTYAW